MSVDQVQALSYVCVLPTLSGPLKIGTISQMFHLLPLLSKEELLKDVYKIQLLVVVLQRTTNNNDSNVR